MFEFIHYRVRDAMTSSPITITPDTPLRAVEHIFEEHDFNGVPVLDDNGDLAGFVTKFDLLKAFTLGPKSIIPHYDDIMGQPAKTVMLREPVTVTPDLPLSRVLQRLVEMRIKSFPVVEGDRLVGIISREDVLAALRRATTHPTPEQRA
jgi:CBS domain-containing protein